MKLVLETVLRIPSHSNQHHPYYTISRSLLMPRDQMNIATAVPLSRRYLNVFVATLNRSRYLDPSKRCFLFVATPINSIYASCMNRTVSSNYKVAISHMPRPTRPMRWAEQLFVMISSKHCRRQSQRSRSRRRTLRSRTWWLRRRKKEEGKQGATSAEALEAD